MRPASFLWFGTALLIILHALAQVGCDRKTTPATPAATGPVRTGTAIIRGTVSLAGPVPVMAMIPNQPCHSGAPALKDESIVADSSGRLQNVIVYIEDAPPAADAGDLPPARSINWNCQYVPHAIALRSGQKLHVTSSDSVMHNVHGQCTANDAFNFALIQAGQSKDLTFSQPEIFFVRCDVHPWMKAIVGVFAHSWFAVTGKDGLFEIRNVPSGSYTLVAWQEKLGVIRVPVKAIDGQTALASLVFR